MTYSPLEINLLLCYAAKFTGCIKARESPKAKTFLLILYHYQGIRPAVRLPLVYWDECQAEDRDISNDTTRTHPCRHWITPDKFKEVTRSELSDFIRNKILK